MRLQFFFTILCCFAGYKYIEGGAKLVWHPRYNLPDVPDLSTLTADTADNKYTRPVIDEQEPFVVRLVDNVTGEIIDHTIRAQIYPHFEEEYAIEQNSSLLVNVTETFVGRLGKFCIHDLWNVKSTQRFRFLPFYKCCMPLNGFSDTMEFPATKELFWMYQGELFVRNWMVMNAEVREKLFIRIAVEYQNETISIDTPLYTILNDEFNVDRITLDSSHSATVTANNPFTIDVKGINKNNDTVTTGIHSKSGVIVNVAWPHKVFNIEKGLWVERTENVLGGNSVVNGRNDKVQYEKMDNGIASITMQLEDVTEDVKINFTIVKPFYSYRRYPEDEFHPGFNVFASYNYFDKTGFTTDETKSNETHTAYRYFQNDTTYFRGVLITNVKVIAQTPSILRIISGHVMRSPQFTNYPIDNPLEIELIDINGYRVTSGPDSSLTVTTHSVVGGTCLSADSVFKLHRGYAKYPGSVCGEKISTSIYFKTTTSAGERQTSSTTSFQVKIKIDVATIHTPGFFYGEQMVGAALLYTHGFYYLGTREIFSVRNASSVNGLKTEIKASEDLQKDILLGFVGPEDGVDNLPYAVLAEGYDVPFVGSGERGAAYSNKVNYPMFASPAFPEKYDFLMLSNMLKSRGWQRIAVICTLDLPPPSTFVESASLFQISYEIVHFPKVESDSTVLSQEKIESFFSYLDSTKTLVFLSFLTGEELNYMAAEVSKRQLHTSSNGYQWLGTKNMLNDFPFDNQGRCQSLNGTTCTDTFKGTMFIKPHYPLYGKSTMSWTIMKSEFGDRWLYPYPFLSSDEDTNVKAALYFDSAMMLVSGFMHFYSNQLTYNPEEFMKAMRTRDIPTTLTDRGNTIKFDENGVRKNYTASLMQLDGTINSTGKANVMKKKRILYLGEGVTLTNITKENVIREIPVEGESLFYATVPTAVQIVINTVSTEGSINQDNLKFSDGLTTPKILVENVPSHYYCTGGCGGNQLSPNSVLLWDNGICVKQEVCRCNIDPITGQTGYTGKTCDKPVCNGCQYGSCDGPSYCKCDTGYVNSQNYSDCAVPTCLTFGCNLDNGECTSADFCKCKPDYYGKDCSKQCSCENGKCSDGESGSGDCVCDSGYMGEQCSTQTAAVMVPVALALIVVILLIAFGVRWKYQQVQLMAALMSTDWKADWDNIRLRQNKQKSSMKSLMSMISMMSGKKENQDKVVSQNQAQWNGRDVVVKYIQKDDIELTEDIRWEIKQMRDLKHPNLCMFVGAVTESPHVSILNEVCGKGSLEDILSNDDIDLGWDFRYSMMKDIVRAMQYLNGSEIVSHGRLKSSNCLVDNRWTVKLADYGMKTFKGNQHGVRVFSPTAGIGISIPKGDEMEQCDYYNLLWTAPEILATGVSHPNHVEYGTTEGDVYSFAIIMAEICTRHHPFHELDHLTPDQIVQMVGRLVKYDEKIELIECRDSENIPIKVLRPQVQRDELPKEDAQAEGLYELVQLCWNQDASVRPSFKDCMSKLNKISPHRGELMDNLIVLMEQYTNNLESIVAERTAELRAEKEQSDVLLSKMLPPLIAEELKSGNNPKPEYFNCVTIYFSDVVGFGKLCADSSPYEVVELLNDLYSVMDDVIDSFDCYKVETIADCYVVASGLPVRNGDQHAGEIASMALQLLSSMNGVGYKHVPNSQVQLRIGIHSGPIVAGVVGLKMPRYCLFGDTMNTASRMESGGFALKIHLSEDTFKILEKLGGYQFICRGERQVKGRGVMTTYWLTGKDGADLNLPTEDQALSASQHDFK